MRLVPVEFAKAEPSATSKQIIKTSCKYANFFRFLKKDFMRVGCPYKKIEGLFTFKPKNGQKKCVNFEVLRKLFSALGMRHKNQFLKI